MVNSFFFFLHSKRWDQPTLFISNIFCCRTHQKCLLDFYNVFILWKCSVLMENSFQLAKLTTEDMNAVSNLKYLGGLDTNKASGGSFSLKFDAQRVGFRLIFVFFASFLTADSLRFIFIFRRSMQLGKSGRMRMTHGNFHDSTP